MRSTIARLSATSDDTATDQSPWLHILLRAEDIDQALQVWESSLTGRWCRRTSKHPLSTTMNVNVDFYNDMQVGKVWNQYRCSRIILHECRIEILERLSSGRQNAVRGIMQSGQIISSLLSDICDSIPFHLRQIDSKGALTSQTSQRVLGAEHLLWPLEVVYRSAWSADSQRSQARDVLRDVNTGLGLAQAAKTLMLVASSRAKALE